MAIKTTDNSAYDESKQGRWKPDDEGYELMACPPSVEKMCEVPSAPPNRDPLPAIPPPVARAEEEEEEGVYDIIPGDK